MTAEGHVKLRNYIILGLSVLVLFLAFKPSPEPKEDAKIFVLEKENERLKVLYNEQKQIAVTSIQKTDSIKALKPKVITKYRTIYSRIDSIPVEVLPVKLNEVFRIAGIDSNNVPEQTRYVLKTVEKVNELTELDSLNQSIIANQDTTINTQKGIIAIADTLHSNDELIKQELKDFNKRLRKQVFKEKVKTRLVAIGGVVLVAVSILAL